MLYVDIPTAADLTSEHIAVAVAREQEKACPLAGSWEGPADAFDRLDVSVQAMAV
jgi:hypothetical protein